MSILSDVDIKNSLLNNDIVIRPFNINNLGNCSYDVTLGSNYYEPDPECTLSAFNPYNQEHVKKYWKLRKAEPASDIISKAYGITPGASIIIIKPHETILCHTNEFIGGVNNITTQMHARSSYGRSGISVCKCSSWGDTNFKNIWTMEVQNSLNIPVILTVGERIAQIVFLRTGPTENAYHIKGAYQNSDDIDELIKNWKPELMLSKLKSEAERSQSS